MTVKEKVIQTVHSLNDEECRQVEEFVQFLRFRSRRRAVPSVDSEELKRLYAEVEDEERELAEAGMADYARGLAEEDAR